MTETESHLLQAMAAALLVVLDNQRHRPSLERHNKIRHQLSQAAWKYAKENRET
jgi:hypothetical protein